MNYTEVRSRRNMVRVPCVLIGGREVVAIGKWIRIARLKDEDLADGEVFPDPQSAILKLQSSGLDADILTFAQRINEKQPKHHYHMEWDNVAAACTESFAAWWENLPQETRKNTRRAAKKGVIVMKADFDEVIVRGIKAIFDESRVRQGMPFWHHGKSIETITVEQGKYADRSEFIGAYFEGELIGFMKFVYVDRVARIMQILSKTSHYDKRPMNALIAKAVEICQEKGMSYLVYSKLTFGNKKNSALAEFKRRNGFEEMRFPRYYIPLTLTGRIALALRLHRGVLGILPSWLIEFLLRVRASVLQVRQGVSDRSAPSELSVPQTIKQ